MGEPEEEIADAIEDQDGNEDRPGKKAHRQSMKTSWIITYGASGPYITAPMLLELGNIEADECHSTKDRAMVYTYIHLRKRVRQITIEKFMTKAKEMHGIVSNAVFGYDAVGSNVRQKGSAPIEEHAGFQMLVKHHNSKNPAFTPWTDGEPAVTRGLIFKACNLDEEKSDTLKSQTKAQIIEYAKSLEGKVREAKKQEKEMHDLYDMYTRVTDERSVLRVENAMLKRKIHEMEESTRRERNHQPT